MIDLSNPRVDSQLKEHIPFENDEISHSFRPPESEPQFYGDILWHWHDEFELGYVTKGSLIYKTNDHEYRLQEGDAIFINSGVLHYLHVLIDPKDIYLYVQFLNTSFLDGKSNGSLYTKYIAPVINQKELDAIPLYHTKKEDLHCLNLIKESAQIEQKHDLFYELHLKAHFSTLWESIYYRAQNQVSSESSYNIQEDMRIKQMILFIEENYSQKLTVQQIANCIPISERECYRLFQSRLHLTPIDFLINFRLKKAQEFLITTQKSILEIALETGFGNSSYFGKLFKQQFHCSPREYRLQFSL